MDATKHYSTREAARILQATEARVRNWARLGGLVPEPGPDGSSEFTFQQLLLLRTTRGLIEAGIPARRVQRIWTSLRRQLAADLPLTSIRILADGERAIAWDEHASWQPDSGQFLLDFDAGEIAAAAAVGTVAAVATDQAVVKPPSVVEAPAPSAEQWFHLACELDDTSPLEARQAYIQALALDPDLADAHVNLGRLDHEAGDYVSAEAHYREAVRCAPEDATCHFNLAVLLDDLGRPDEAIRSYMQAIARDPEAADAHYNVGLLLESRGRRPDAMRHLMTARRLYAPEKNQG
jgi:tetratricopeptide (TPR) repeat protein